MQDEKNTNFSKKIFGQKSSCCSLELEKVDSNEDKISPPKNPAASCCGGASQEMDAAIICKNTNSSKKPVVNFKKCFTDKHVCTAIKACPVEAISYIEVEEPILNKKPTICFDRCPMAARGISATINLTEKNTGCLSTANLVNNKSGDIIEGVGNPWGRIIIDYDKCFYCRKCVDACCGYAIDWLCEDPNCDCCCQDDKSCD